MRLLLMAVLCLASSTVLSSPWNVLGIAPDVPLSLAIAAAVATPRRLRSLVPLALGASAALSSAAPPAWFPLAFLALCGAARRVRAVLMLPPPVVAFVSAAAGAMAEAAGRSVLLPGDALAAPSVRALLVHGGMTGGLAAALRAALGRRPRLSRAWVAD